MGPEVVPGTKEEDGELSDLVPQVLDVGGDVPGMVDLCRPPPEEDATQSDPAGPDTAPPPPGPETVPLGSPVLPQLHPDDVGVLGLLAGPAVVAEPAAVGHGDVEAVGVEGSRTRLAAQQPPPWKTRE